MTVFNSGPQAMTMDFHAGDIGDGRADLGFKTAQYEEISLSDWLTHTPPELVAQHLNIDAAVVPQFPNNAPGFLPL